MTDEIKEPTPIKPLPPNFKESLERWQMKPGEHISRTPKGLIELIRTKTNGGTVLVDTVMAIIRSKRVDAKTKLDAVKVLASYGWGTPAAAAPVHEEERVKEAAKKVGKDPEEAWQNYLKMKQESRAS